MKRTTKRFTISALAWTIITLSVITNLSLADSVSIDLQPFATGFSQPVGVTNAGDTRLFVVEQAGIIQIVDATGTIAPAPFLDITDRVNSSGTEQGLLGLAFHPDYSSNGYFYVNYTDLAGDTVVSRFSVTLDPNIGDPGSELVLLSFSQPYSNHNAGDLKFGPDGYLYIATGDGGSGGDPQNYAQNPATFLGKILRIDVDTGMPYGIPADNPFISDPGTLDEIWALGLRNPWRISFDRVSGDLWIADVGQQEMEEINFQVAGSSGGENYGWRCYEGTLPYNTSGCDVPGAYVFPVFEFPHPAHCSVTGGFVYRGSSIAGLVGHYIFTDYCSGNFWSLEWDGVSAFNVTDFGSLMSNISSFGENDAGELFAVKRNSGVLYQLVQTAPGVPSTSVTGIILLLSFIGLTLIYKR